MDKYVISALNGGFYVKKIEINEDGVDVLFTSNQENKLLTFATFEAAQRCVDHHLIEGVTIVKIFTH